eukprot:1151067-Pelagomonas_calceolata.AAC.3
MAHSHCVRLGRCYERLPNLQAKCRCGVDLVHSMDLRVTQEKRSRALFDKHHRKVSGTCLAYA